MHSFFRERRDILVGIAYGEIENLNLQLKLALEIPFNMHEIYVDFMPERVEQPFCHATFKYREKLILDYSCIFNQVEKSSTSALHRTPDPSTLPTPPSEPKLVNVTSTSVTLAWNKIQQKPGGTSFIGYSVEYFSADLQRGWVSALQRIPSNVVTVS